MSLDAERMSRVDTAWLRMDNDVNLMMIVGVWLLEPGITLAALRRRVEERFLRYARFRQRAVPDLLGASWVEDDDFDLSRHVVTTKLPRRRGQDERAALKTLCAELAATPLDPQRPLWQFHLIERYEGGSAIVVRLHHCIADGIALISVMLSITDGGAEPPKHPQHAHGHDHSHEHDWLADAVLRPITDLTVKAIGMYGNGVARSMEMLAHPQAPLWGSLAVARHGWQVVHDAASLALMADDSPTALKGKPGGLKAVAWNEPLPLDTVKAVGKALGCSINDVLLACVAGAIGRYLHECGDDPAGKEIRAMVPVNLRPMDKAWQLGNRFGLAPLVLPIGITNPIERVYAVRQRMAELKGSYQPLLAFAVLAMAGFLVKPVQDAVLNLFARKTTAVMTNVPGPREPLKFCGSTLRQTMFWVPASGDVGLGVSVLSYGGGVQFGLIADTALCPDPEAIVERFEPEFEKLLWLTMMLPWPGEDGAAA
ncbi:wax ester/triacylglycerol synthase family O-acyltransferase [Rubrivivax benzoatilyticus]|uniref:diacylglycerol O-acyltransferase n=1 Tax=Rubrivivax benzoatilyticus TaxID=316997 RepID=A0ABX0HPQ2_9BURK|nr:wax ester/triacylglycerol synthase family O-acyltransferase [Rubrivivax benzoatilyticus]MCD0418632.1 wax ester/triacylglycerol synthase family O-acyltransferase [Rubrivivax sp. JA1024]NHK97049.1 wax ester/triacylglycerol synthase family O-acyltransferase [Rubrivivax benzoatilyticus]NHL24764.1 wax ester/triacylglycerol synthase family O-acyltransferase [Rubrivivax benzoatilyticus]